MEEYGKDVDCEVATDSAVGFVYAQLRAHFI